MSHLQYCLFAGSIVLNVFLLFVGLPSKNADNKELEEHNNKLIEANANISKQFIELHSHISLQDTRLMQKDFYIKSKEDTEKSLIQQLNELKKKLDAETL